MQTFVRTLFPLCGIYGRASRIALPVLLFVVASPLWSQTAVVGLGAGAGLPGANVTLIVTLAGGSDAAALQWRMNYASADLSFIGAADGLSATQANKSVQCEGDGGVTTCIVVGFNTNSIANGTVATVTFQIAQTASPGSKEIILTDVSAAAGDGSNRAATGTNGGVSVQQIVNLPPSVSDGATTTNEDVPVSISLVASDPEGDALTYSYGQPLNGVVSGVAPSVVYTPVANSHGQDQFTFVATDTQGQSGSGTVVVTVQPVNDPPSAADQTATTQEDVPLAITLNGTDPDGDGLTFSVQTSPANGVLSGTAPNLAYSPNPEFAGEDQFTFQTSDPGGLSDIGTVVITVQPANDAPTATDQNVTTSEDTPLPVILSGADPDGDVLSYSVESLPQHGFLTGTAPNLTYAPNQDFHGQDSFTFSVADQGEALGAMAVTTAIRSRGSSGYRASAKGLDPTMGVIVITIEAVNDTPLAQDQAVAVANGQPVTITLQAADPDGDTLDYQIESGPSHGALSGTAPQLTYTSEQGYSGDDSFVFRALDPDGASDTGTVTLVVEASEPQNGPPNAEGQDVTTDEDVPLEITLNATDPDGDALTYSVTAQPASGSLSGAAPNLTYTPNQDFNGIDALTFSVSDGNGDSDGATVGITILPINDLPTATSIQVETEKGEAIEIHLEGEDLDEDPLTFTLQSNPSHGSLSGSAPDLTYTPDEGFAGSDSFDFLVSDTGGESAGGTVSITVTDGIISEDKPAVFSEGTWKIDQNGDGEYDGPPADREFFFSSDNQDTPVVGDWSGSGRAYAGVFLDGSWYLDVNGNGVWDGVGIDLLCSIGEAGDTPVVGDWDGSGVDKVGVFRKGTWRLDWNGNGVWDGDGIDREYSFGNRRDVPVVGDWTGSGRDSIGTFSRGSWELDWNGNGLWDGFNTDRFVALGRRGDVPLVGDWNGSGSDKVGVYRRRRNSRWELDRNGDGVFDRSNGDVSARLGGRGDEPVVGDWDGSGVSKIGVFDDGEWLLDRNGDGKWSGETIDRRASVGGLGDRPVVGRW